MDGKKIFGIILLIAGGISIMTGLSVRNSFEYQLGNAFGKSNGTDPVTTYCGIGIVAAVIGLVLLVSKGKEK